MCNAKLKLAAALVAFLALAVVGCSNLDSNNPLSSSNLTGSPAVGEIATLGAPAAAVQFQAKIATMDQTRRMLTFEERPDTVIANQNCQIVRLNNDGEAPMAFGELKPGDSVEVNGNRYQNGYVYVHRIAVCTAYQGQYDLAFRDTIATIDYVAGTFTVIGRTELIHVDENTEIWGNVITGPNRNTVENPAACGSGPGTPSRDTVLTFMDLKEGDVVEVRALQLENGDLLAVKIKVANCQTTICSQFDATLASVNADLRIVTFVDLAWTGLVGKGAKLLAADGSVLTLADFAAGEAVHVQGFPLPADSLKVCLMQKL